MRSLLHSRLRLALPALCAGYLVAVPLRASAQGEVGCPEGTAAESASRFEEAANGYLACAARSSSPGEQAWASSRTARVLAVKLFRFDEAAAILDDLARDFPTDPRAMAARGLASEIREGRSAGDDALRLYYTVRERPDLLGREGPVPALRRIVDEFPSFPHVDWVMKTLAVELRQRDDVEGALRVLATMRERFAGQPAAALAVLETGATYFHAGRFTDAATWFRRLADFGGSAPLGEQSARRAEAHRARQRIERVATAVIVGWLAWIGLATYWRRIRPETITHALREAAVTAPLWLIFLVVSFNTSPGIHRPIWWMAGATLAVVTLSNLCLLTRRPARGLRWFHGLLTTGAMVAIVYAVLYRYDLVFTLEETLRVGPSAG